MKSICTKKESELLLKLGKSDCLDKIFEAFPYTPDEEVIYPYKTISGYSCTVQYHKGGSEKPNVFVQIPGTDRCLFYKPLRERRIEVVDESLLSKECKFIASPAAVIDRYFNGEKYYVYSEITDALDLDLSTEVAFSIANSSYFDELIKTYGRRKTNFGILDFYLKESAAGKIKFEKINHKYPLFGNKYVKDSSLPSNGRNVLFIDADTFVNCRYAPPLKFILQKCVSQIASAISFLHSKDIVYLDLKSENILPSIDINGNIQIRLIDLESCCPVGTIVEQFTFVPPEACNTIPLSVKRAYSTSEMNQSDFCEVMNSVSIKAAKSIDVWLFGILLVRLFMSQSLMDEYNNCVIYNEHGKDILYDKITAELKELNLKQMDPYFAGLLTLVEACLRTDPDKRPTMEEVLRNPFFKVDKYGGLTNCLYMEFVAQFRRYKFSLVGKRIYFDPRGDPLYIDKTETISNEKKRKRSEEARQPLRAVKRPKIDQTMVEVEDIDSEPLNYYNDELIDITKNLSKDDFYDVNQSFDFDKEEYFELPDFDLLPLNF